MKISREARITQSFVLEPGDMEALLRAFQLGAIAPKIEAECADQIKRQFDSPHEFLAHENPRSREIVKLSLRGLSEDGKVYASLRLDTDLYSNIIYSVEGEEPKAFQVIQQLDDAIAAMKPAYNWIAKADFTFLFICIWLAYTFASLMDLGHTGLPSKLPSLLVLTGIVAAVVFVSSLFWGLMNKLWKKLRFFLFPMGVYAIGQGVKRKQHGEFIRIIVILGLLLSFLGSVAATLMFIKWS